MESKIAGYKLVPEINSCEGCAFFEIHMRCPYERGNNDCYDNFAIYVPADTAIEVPKTNQNDRQRKD